MLNKEIYHMSSILKLPSWIPYLLCFECLYDNRHPIHLEKT
jgi:hypothetical protein